tara:strand:+ start:1698 stop:1859 length:162 start_codon:yes stop_codon:yes gene_type:complete
VDTSSLDARLRDAGEKNNRWYEGALPADFEIVSVLQRAEAVDLLSEFLFAARR